MKARIVVLLMSVALMMPIVGGCGEEEPRSILLGCAVSLSGAHAEEGRLTQEGYELWEEHVDSQCGILIGNARHPVDIIYYDDESNPQKTALLVRNLIDDDEVDFLLGPYGSSSTLEAAAIAEEYGIPMVEGGGSAEEIFASGFEHTFGLLSASRDFFESTLEGAAFLDPRPNRVAILSRAEFPLANIAEGAKWHADLLGFDVVFFHIYEPEEDLSSVLSTVKDYEPNIVLVCAHFAEAAPFVLAAKAVGLSPASCIISQSQAWNVW